MISLTVVQTTERYKKAMMTIRKRYKIAKPVARLERFAEEYGLKTRASEESDPDTDRPRRYREIAIGESLIIDPTNDPLLIDLYCSKIGLNRALRNCGVKRPLWLLLSLKQENCLWERIGFDVPAYDNGSGDPADPNSSNWGTVLERVGIKYLCGDDLTISFLFPSGDRAAVAVALALARIQ